MPDWLSLRGNAGPPEPSVTADHGSMAAGRDINFFGLDEDGVRRVLQEELARIAGEKGVPIAPLRAVLEKLGAAEIANEDIPKRLAAAADELLVLRQELQRLRNDRPELAVIRDEALALIDAGNLDAARAALDRGREAARASREETSRNEAEFLADVARIDHLQLAYRSAAQKYAEAATLVAPFDRDAAWQYVLQQADELQAHGNEFGDNQALVEAIGVYRGVLTLVSRERVPFEWAKTQNDLGRALATLGERESGTARLEEAVAAYRDALKELTRESVPLHWAVIQNNLGAALWALGERESGTAHLEEAVAAYSDALMERTRERVPMQVGHHAEQSRQCAHEIWRARERHRAPRSGRRRLSRRAEGIHPRARAARNGPRPRSISVLRSGGLASTRTTSYTLKRPSPPIATH